MSYKSESKTDSGAGDPQFTGRNQPYQGAKIQLTFKKSKQKNNTFIRQSYKRR